MAGTIGYRADFVSMSAMMETSPGVNPGIVNAPWVDGTTEATPFVPNSTLRAFIRLMGKPDNLPTIPLVEVDQAKQVRSYDNLRVQGIRAQGGQFVTKIALHGWSRTPGAARPTLPPWQYLMASGCGLPYGHDAAHGGGSATTVATATSDKKFSLAAGTAKEGHVLGVRVGGSSGRIEPVRPTQVTTDTSTDDQVEDSLIGLSATPTVGDSVFPSTTLYFDKREETNSPCFTFLFGRSKLGTSLIVKGCRAVDAELMFTVGEVAHVAITWTYMDWTYQSEGGSDWTGYTGIDQEPAYYATQYPEPFVVQNSHFVWEDSAGARQTPLVRGFRFKWMSGVQQWLADNGSGGVGALVATGDQSMEGSFTVLYDDEWRSFVGVEEVFPMFYVAGNDQGHCIFFHCASTYLLVDPGTDTESENNQAQEIKFGHRDYNGDTSAYTVGAPAQSMFSVGTL